MVGQPQGRGALWLLTADNPSCEVVMALATTEQCVWIPTLHLLPCARASSATPYYPSSTFTGNFSWLYNSDTRRL